MSERGQRGKPTEKLVEDVLKRFNASANFAYFRLPDSRSARSFIKANPADFLYRCGEYAGFIEAKATEHAYRLPTSKVSQIQTLHKFALAGSDDLVIVHHTVENVWRCVAVKHLPLGVPSWDLREFDTYGSAEEALRSSFWFDGV